MKNIGIVFAVATAIAWPAAAAPLMEPANKRLCADKDINGMYQLADYRESPKSVQTTWTQQFKSQYYSFNSAEHTYQLVASSRRLKDEADFKRSLALSIGDAMHLADRKYTLDDTGLLSLYIGERLEASYRCFVVTKTLGNEAANDIALDGYTRYRTEEYKLYRHWP